jgi:8-oxo-dGTP diphosphatase
MTAPRGNRSAFSVDLVVLTALTSELAVLVQKGKGESGRWTLPWGIPVRSEAMATVAGRLSISAVGEKPTWIEQLGAFGDGRRHPSTAQLSVGFVAVVPHETASLERGFHWFPVRDLPQLSPRHRQMVDGALEVLRDAVDRAPIAFRLLPDTFTLSELQQMYELLLGKRLHKASFRRALQAASLVEATDEWRSEGRGRPAQLYRFGPKRRRRLTRGVRFDLIAGGSV